MSLFEYDRYAPWYDAQNQMDDIPFYLEAIEQYGDPVLELGCGTGRLLVPIAREGFHVTGIDISKHMLQIARQKIAQEPDTVKQFMTISFADMKEFQLLPLFKTVIFGCNTFQHLLSNAEQDQALTCAHRHMADEGRLFLQSTHIQLDEHQSDVLYYRGREVHPDTHQRVDIFYSYNTFPQKQIQQLHLFMDILTEEGQVERQKIVLTFRYFFPPELERLLEANGFELEALYGDFQKNPLTSQSPWIVAQAKKR